MSREMKSMNRFVPEGCQGMYLCLEVRRKCNRQNRWEGIEISPSCRTSGLWVDGSAWGCCLRDET